MVQLIHGGDIYTERKKGRGEGLLDFSANINPLGMPESVINAVAAGLSDCVNYPDPLSRDLILALSRRENLPEACFVCGNGAADVLFRLVVAKAPGRAMVTAPTFAEYQLSLERMGCRVEHHYLKEEEGFRLTEELLPKLDAGLDMLFLCNPNNPTGQIIETGLLLKILDRCKELGILLVLDECFCDFVKNAEDYTMKSHVLQCGNLFILKAFTKNYAMPGLRLGYGICGNKELTEQIWETGQPWSVSLPAQLAGLQALKEEEFLEKTRELIFVQRERMACGLRELGFTVYPPGANFIFFKLGEGYQASGFKELLLQHGILIRGCGNYTGLSGDFFRVAVKKEEDNNRLLEALKRIRKR